MMNRKIWKATLKDGPLSQEKTCIWTTSDIDYENCEKIKTKDKQTLSGWLVDAVDLVRNVSLEGVHQVLQDGSIKTKKR